LVKNRLESPASGSRQAPPASLRSWRFPGALIQRPSGCNQPRLFCLPKFCPPQGSGNKSKPPEANPAGGFESNPTCRLPNRGDHGSWSR
jgi:hypothetical protein